MTSNAYCGWFNYPKMYKFRNSSCKTVLCVLSIAQPVTAHRWHTTTARHKVRLVQCGRFPDRYPTLSDRGRLIKFHNVCAPYWFISVRTQLCTPNMATYIGRQVSDRANRGIVCCVVFVIALGEVGASGTNRTHKITRLRVSMKSSCKFKWTKSQLGWQNHLYMFVSIPIDGASCM